MHRRSSAYFLLSSFPSFGSFFNRDAAVMMVSTDSVTMPEYDRTKLDLRILRGASVGLNQLH